MHNPFTLLDIKELMESFGAASFKNDCLLPFLRSYDFEDIYGTEDDSLVFEAGGENEVGIEFIHFENPLTREVSIMYRENGKYVNLSYDQLKQSF